MDAHGVVMMNDDIVGTFALDEHERVTIAFNAKSSSVVDMLEFAAENGMNLALAYQPDFDEYLPKHHQEI